MACLSVFETFWAEATICRNGEIIVPCKLLKLVKESATGFQFNKLNMYDQVSSSSERGVVSTTDIFVKSE